MDKDEKFVRKLPLKERKIILALVGRVILRKWSGLDIKRLSGHKDIYRLRKGDVRILFQDKGDDIEVFSIGKRNEETYKDY